MKKVNVFKYEKAAGKTYHDRVFSHQAKFHQWGVDYEELDLGAGNYSVAIVELEDGKIEMPHAAMVEFVKEAE